MKKSSNLVFAGTDGERKRIAIVYKIYRSAVPRIGRNICNKDVTILDEILADTINSEYHDKYGMFKDLQAQYGNKVLPSYAFIYIRDLSTYDDQFIGYLPIDCEENINKITGLVVQD